MSACISRHGEYSVHDLDSEHTCQLCGVLDEGALRDELRALRAETTTATDEDAASGEVLIDDTDWVPWRDLPRYAAKQKRAAEDAQREAKMHYLAREELEGLLATARTRPSRDLSKVVVEAEGDLRAALDGGDSDE